MSARRPGPVPLSPRFVGRGGTPGGGRPRSGRPPFSSVGGRAMADDGPNRPARSFLGTGWSFPPEFRAGGVVMTDDEEDIRASLAVLFRTAPGERFLQPKYGLDV